MICFDRQNFSGCFSVKKRILYEEESRLIFKAKCHEIKNQEFQTKLKCEQEYFSLLIFRTKGIMIFSGKNNQKVVQMRVLSYELKGILLVHKLISDQCGFYLINICFTRVLQSKAMTQFEKDQTRLASCSFSTLCPPLTAFYLALTLY